MPYTGDELHHSGWNACSRYVQSGIVLKRTAICFYITTIYYYSFTRICFYCICTSVLNAANYFAL